MYDKEASVRDKTRVHYEVQVTPLSKVSKRENVDARFGKYRTSKRFFLEREDTNP
jgi:hypothetical protein